MAAGLSIGMVSLTDSSGEISDFVLLKDILGSEDHHGDMDFKIAGSSQGVTAIQLDVKLAGGVPLAVLFQALDMAREGRTEILDIMHRAVSSLTDKYSAIRNSNRTGKTDLLPLRMLRPFAPRAEIVQCDEDRRNKLIGKGGEMIMHIKELFSCEVDVDENGMVYIFGKNAKEVRQAANLVRDVATNAKEVSQIFSDSILFFY